MEILVAYCHDCDLVFDFKNSGVCPECGGVPAELVATSKKAVEQPLALDAATVAPKCTTEKLCPVHNVWHAAPPRK